jgi:hypothetical protein
VPVPETQARLRRARVPDWFHVTAGGLGTRECIKIEPASRGRSACFSERGGKRGRDTCADKDSACRAMIRRIDRMMREAGPGFVSAVN